MNRSTYTSAHTKKEMILKVAAEALYFPLSFLSKLHHLKNVFGIFQSTVHLESTKYAVFLLTDLYPQKDEIAS